MGGHFSVPATGGAPQGTLFFWMQTQGWEGMGWDGVVESHH